ncbi:MAG: hypothetical protein NVS2B2_08950 [Ktedonobacteraceae bacterium]
MNTEMRHALQRTEYVLSVSVPLRCPQDDTDVVQASQHGDQHAFALLMQCPQQRVYAVSVPMLPDPEDANKATQEAFLAAWPGLPEFHGNALFSSWLYRIAYYCYLRMLDQHMHEHLLQEVDTRGPHSF